VPAGRTALVLLTALAVLAADQATKAAVRQQLLESGEPSIPLLGGLVRFSYVENRGSAFGFFQNQTLFFILIGFLVVGGILVGQRYVPAHRTALTICLGLLLGGASGNLVDRLRDGYVFDFVDLKWWPVFNLADSAIVAGVAVLAYHLLFRPIGDPQADGRGGESDGF
jgi:signal peptidase II